VAAPDTFYDVATRRLDEQIDRIGALDTKAATALSAAAALLPIFGALVAAFTTSVDSAAATLYGIGLVIYLGMIGSAVFASRVSKWDFRPDLDTLAGHAKTESEATVKNWVAQECVRSITSNAPKLTKKSLYVDLSLVGLVLVTLCLSAAAFFQLT
jgi:hypothetical protein